MALTENDVGDISQRYDTTANADRRDISQRIAEQRDLYRPKNIQETYLATAMSDILLIYFAVDEALKKANELDVATDKVLGTFKSDLNVDEKLNRFLFDFNKLLNQSVADNKKTLLDEVDFFQKQIEAYTSKIEKNSTVAIEKSIEKSMEGVISAGERRVEKVLDKVVITKKLFSFAVIFALCTSVVTGVFVYAIVLNEKQEAVSDKGVQQSNKLNKQH